MINMFNCVFNLSSTIKHKFFYILIIIIGLIQLKLLSLRSRALFIECYIVNTNLPSRTNTNSKTSFTKPPSTIGQSSRGNYYNNYRFNQHLSGPVTNNPDYSNEQNNDERRLFNYLMRNYDNTIRPVINASKPINIRLGITLTQIFDLDEKNQVLTTNVWLDQEWIDEFLTWNSSEFGNITKIRIPCQSIWLPDIVLYNNADDYTRGYMNSRAIIEPNGNVFWPPPTKFRSTCPVDVTYFPFDDQKCTMKLGSWIYDGLSVDIENRTQNVDLSNYVSNGEWNLISTNLVRNVVYYPCCFEPFPDVTITLVIRRKILYYMYNVIVPCIMMSLLTLLVFCLPPESGEKIALGVTVLLAFSVFMLAISEKLPETSESIPLLGVYLTVVMGITSVSILMTVVVLNFHYCSPLNKRELPNWIRQWLLKNDQTIFDDYQKARSMSMTSTTAGCCVNRSYHNGNDSYHPNNNGLGTASIEKQLNGSVKHNCSNNTIVEDYDDDMVDGENGNDVNDDDKNDDEEENHFNYETRTGTDILSASELFSSIQNDNSISNLLIKQNNVNHNCTAKNINDQQESDSQQTSNRYCFDHLPRIQCRKSKILNNLNDNYHQNMNARHYYSQQQPSHQCRPNSNDIYLTYPQTDTPSMVQYEKDTGRQNCGIATNRQLLNSIVCCATAAATGLIHGRNRCEHPVSCSKHDLNALYINNNNNDNIGLTSKLFVNRNCRPINNPSEFYNKHYSMYTTRKRDPLPPTPPPPPINYSSPESISITDRWKHNYNDNSDFHKQSKNIPIIETNQKQNNASIDQELIQMLRYLMHRQEIDDNINRRLHEWRLFSMFIDKVLFWIFTITTIVTSVVFLLIIPVKRRGF